MDTSKIIIGTVGGGRYTVTAPIVKEDYGLYLKIEGLELPSTYEVDFSNSEHNGTSVTMIGNSDGVLIPAQFIKSGKDVFAFLYHVGDNYGRTVYKFRIPNKLRPDRTDETPTPEEQSVIDQAISALNTAVEQTAQDVIDADASAQSAQGYAESAEGYAESASTSATEALASETTARSYANSASASATASANSASQSAQIKSDVEDLVDDAQASASASAQSANASANSASQASASATSASQSTTSAQGYASSAQTSAQTASAKASEASASASTASQKASESAQSATNAQTYATQAETAKMDAQTAQGLAESARDTAVQAKTDAESARDEAQNLVDGISGKVEQIDSNTERIESLEDDRYKPYAVDTASGSIASFTDGADDIPLKSLIVDINPVQDLSQGDPSPENICPISGWTGCNVKHWSKNWIENASNAYSLTTSNFAKYTPSASLKDITSGTFSVSANVPSGQTLKLFGYDGRNNNSFGTLVRQTDGRYSVTSNWTTFKNTVEFRVYSQPYTGGSSVVTEISDAMLAVNDTNTDYIPYNGTTIPISWQTEAGTVYGGKLDVLSGEGKVTHGVVDLGSLRWEQTDTERHIFRTSELTNHKLVSGINVLCSGYTPVSASLPAANMADKTCKTNSSNSMMLYVRDTSYASTVDFKAGVAGILVVYELAAPTDFTATPQTVSTLYGQNNIFADTGDTSVEYRADTKLYIEKLTQPEEDDMIADSAITSGQFFMIGNSLYRALTNIASGATITVGTNAQRVSLSDALNLINT